MVSNLCKLFMAGLYDISQSDIGCYCKKALAVVTSCFSGINFHVI